MMRSRTPWDWRLKLYPFIALGLYVYVAAGGSLTPSRTVEHTRNAEPQTAAFPDRTCFYGRYPLESFCFVLTEERR